MPTRSRQMAPFKIIDDAPKDGKRSKPNKMRPYGFEVAITATAADHTLTIPYGAGACHVRFFEPAPATTAAKLSAAFGDGDSSKIGVWPVALFDATQTRSSRPRTLKLHASSENKITLTLQGAAAGTVFVQVEFEQTSGSSAQPIEIE